LFKVSADFEESMARTDDNDQLYARMIATLVQRQKLLPFDADAVARVIEFSARQVGDSERLSTHMLGIADLLHEVDYWSRQQQCDCVTASLIQQAIDRQKQRYNRIQQRLHDEVRRGILLFNTHTDEVGQVNGLFVIEMGQHSFSYPVRITATTRLGEGEVIDIEREVELGGALHSKGVMILSAFIASHYAADRPLSLAASLVFEQTYGPVDGDSASLAECCVLLSSLANVALHQGLAVTGSVNQHGQIQAIGGVNDKIEGFYDVCSIQGLGGKQGVIIPKTNVMHLMLRQDIRDAVAAGRFNLYAVDTVDQTLELLSGLPAGQRDEQGQYPEGSFNQRIENRIIELAELRQYFTQGGDHSGERGSDQGDAPLLGILITGPEAD
jgi:predicted ATP-dependent protease